MLPYKRKLAVLISIALSQFFIIPMIPVRAETIAAGEYNPRDNDDRIDVTTVGGGSVITLETPDVGASFEPGKGPAAETQELLSDLKDQGHVNDTNNIIDREIISLGPNTNPITVPDPITGGYVSIQTYNSTNFTEKGTVGDIKVNVYEGVGDDQYINMAIGEVESSGGSLTIEFGDGSSDHTNNTNQLDLAAKQSTLFDINGENSENSELHWNSNNRVNFFGVSISPPGITTLNVQNIAKYSGIFSVETVDGKSHLKNVNDIDSLKQYNDWLITELHEGNLNPDDYDLLFNKAITIENKTIEYEQLISYSEHPEDDIFKGSGKREIINAHGNTAQVYINAKLEGQNATSAVNLSDNAALTVSANGMLGNVNGSTVKAKDSNIINDGVINSDFIVDANGNIVNADVNGNIKGIDLSGSSTLINNNIINISSNDDNGSGAGIYLADSSTATNTSTGTINVGVTTENSAGITSGVEISSKEASFINEGEIYIGREHQMVTGETVDDVKLNQKGLAGIRVTNAGNATNNSDITIGTLAQNSAAMFAGNGKDISLINNGTIILKDNSGLASTPNTNYGMYVYNSSNGSNIKNNGTITLDGVNARAIQAMSDDAEKSAHIETTAGSILNIKGAATGDKIRNYGVWVEGKNGGSSTATIDGEVNLQGDGAIGIHARGKAVITVEQNAIPDFSNGTDQIGFFAYGDDARIIINGTNALQVNTDKSTLFRLENGADFTDADFVDLDLQVIGNEARGVVGSGNGSLIQLNDTLINVAGNSAVGISIDGAAKGELSSGVITTLNGDSSIGAIVDGNKYSLDGTVTGDTAEPLLTSDAKISTSLANNATGYIIQNRGQLTHTGDINFTNGTNNTGILINKDGVLNNSGNVYVANGTGVRATGAGAQSANIGTINVDDGTAGVHLLDGANLNISGGTAEINVGGTAHGIFVDEAAGSLNASDLKINVDLNGTGNGIENGSSTQSISLTNVEINTQDGSGIRTGVAIDPNSTVTINVTGSGAGFAFTGDSAATTTTLGDFTLGLGYKINVSGENGIGMKALTDGGNVVTQASVNVTNAAGGTALLAGTAASTLNLGDLISLSKTAPVVDLTNSTVGTIFENQGVIKAASVDDKAILGSDQADKIYMSSGSIQGEIDSGNGNDYILFNGGTLDGSITMGSGENQADIIAVDLTKTKHITAESGTIGKSSLNFSGMTYHGGSFDADDLTKGVNLGSGWNKINFDNAKFTLTDNLNVDTTTQAAEVTLQSNSTFLAGNGVNAKLLGTTSRDLTFKNYGTIDLTNGNSKTSDVFTIAGNYEAGSDLKLDTNLNEGGPLANQETDRLLIEGNAKGKTTINVNIDDLGKADSGGGTDVNANGTIEAFEGISLVQVAGESSKDAFELKNGYIAAGAFAYELYAFEPGESKANQRIVEGVTSGDQFWDYRLANGIVSTRLRVIPQVGSYLSLATGLGYSNGIIIDDLHKRLGELRYQSDLSAIQNGTEKEHEFFARYIGADNEYKTNRHFNDFGYGFDLKTNAFQVGGNVLNINDSDDDNLQMGVAWSHGTSKLTPDAFDGFSRTKTDFDTVGLYSTWQNKAGFYLDGIVAATWNKSKIETELFSNANTIESEAFTFSAEGGYQYVFDNDWILEPQAQLTYSIYDFDDTIDKDLVEIKYNSYDQLIGRLGLRATRAWQTDGGTKFIPYFRINYYHDFESSSDIMISSTDGKLSHTFQSGDFGDTIQTGFGLTIDNPNGLIFYGEIDYQDSLQDAGLKGVRGNVGFRWQF